MSLVTYIPLRSRTRSYLSYAVLAGLCCCLCIFAAPHALAQATTFAGNAQHTSVYAAPAQNLNIFKWTTSIDLNNTGALIHYGAPLVTAANTVLVPVKTGSYRRLSGERFQRRERCAQSTPCH